MFIQNQQGAQAGAWERTGTDSSTPTTTSDKAKKQSDKALEKGSGGKKGKGKRSKGKSPRKNIVEPEKESKAEEADKENEREEAARAEFQGGDFQVFRSGSEASKGIVAIRQGGELGG